MQSPHRVVLFAIALAGCPASPAPVTGPGPVAPSGPAAAGSPRIDAIEAAVDLDGQLVGPLRRGQTATVAMVFASWCVHCRHEMPVLARLRERNPSVRVIGVNYRAHEEYDGRGSSAAVRAFVTEQAPWLRVVPAGEELWTSLGRPPKVPTVYVFDGTGALVRAFDRRTDAIPTLDELEAALPR